MVRILLVFLSFLLVYSCSVTSGDDGKSNSPGPKDADSLVICNLIKKSNENYYNKNLKSSVYDDFIKEAEEIARKDNNEIQLSKIYSTIAKRFRNKSYYKEAIQYYEKAITIAEKYQRDDMLTDYYNQIAVVYRRMDQNPVALDYHFEALKIAESLKDSFNIEVSLNGIGNINLSLKRYHAAIEYFRRSLSISENERNMLGQAINYNNIGEAFLGLGQVDSALHYFFTSLEKNRVIKGDHFGESICYNSIGDAYIAKGEINKALDFLKKALEINLKEGDRLHVSVSYVNLGETYMKAGDYNNAEYYLKKGLDVAMDIGSIFQIKEGYRLLSELNEMRGDYKKALDLQKLSNVYKDSLINEKTLHYISTLETVLESEKQGNRILKLSREKLNQELKIKQQRMIIITVILLMFALAFAIALIIYQNRLRSSYKSLKYQQQLLRTQMNPHFIFNALSAIQVFILENDKEKAAAFLSDFAKLMRQVLKSSNYEYISLKEEIDVIGYYLRLQQLRFSKPFKYEIKIDEELDISTVMVPPMLTQPFLENAIEHGFKHSEEEGFLFVRFLRSGNSLIIEVDDNGTGIDSTTIYKDKEHESMAIRITKARLHILEKDAKFKTSFSVIDKRRLNPFDKGTLVRFVLPLIISQKR
jgi:tetratricopeptide (TPR) repeat protein